MTPQAHAEQAKKPPLTVALTGGIASGKSTVADMFSSWGATIVDADTLAREVVAPGTDGLGEVVSVFGASILQQDGSLDRKKLGKLVFSDPNNRQKLERILHPRIRQRWLSLRQQILTLSPPLLVYAVPLYFETGASFPEVDRIITVTAPESWRVQRVMNRDHLTEQEARQRISSQLPDTVKAEKSDFVIENDGSLDDLSHRAKKVYDALTAKQG